MRKSDYIEKKRASMPKYPIPKEKVEAVCDEWKKAELDPNRWLDTHDNFYDTLPKDAKDVHFKKYTISRCFNMILENWEKYANGGVHPEKNRWYKLNEIKVISKSFIKIMPYNETTSEKVYFRKNRLFRLLFRNPKHPHFSAHRYDVVSAFRDDTFQLFAELCEQAHALAIMNAVIEGNVEGYIKERQERTLTEPPRPKVEFGKYVEESIKNKPLRKINGLYVCPHQWLNPVSIISIIAGIIGMVAILGLFVGFMYFLIEGGIFSTIICLLILLFL